MISIEAAENIFNSKSDFWSKNLPELESCYCTRMGIGGVKGKRFGSQEEETCQLELKQQMEKKVAVRLWVKFYPVAQSEQ